jgi:hypothetical protein
MKSQRNDLVDLGRVSRRTLGADGPATDLVRMLDHWGIAKD